MSKHRNNLVPFTTHKLDEGNKDPPNRIEPVSVKTSCHSSLLNVD